MRLNLRKLVIFVVVGVFSTVAGGMAHFSGHAIAPAFADQSTCAAPTQTGEAAAPTTLIYDGQQLAKVKAAIRAGDPYFIPAYCALVAQAKALLTATPLSVLDGTRTYEGCDEHDFLTFTATSWPDPTKPNGLPWKAQALKINPALTSGTDLTAFRTTMSRIRTLGLAYYFSGRPEFAQKAAEFARVWFLDPATLMNPNTRCEGIIPGRPPHGSTFSARSVMDAAEGLALLAGSPAWMAKDRAGFERWIATYLAWATKYSPNGGAHTANQPTNVGVYHDAQVIYYALATGDKALAEQTVRLAAERRIASRILSTGEQPVELRRYNGWGYSLLSLYGLLTIAELSRHTSVDLFDDESSDGRLLAKAVEYLAQYARTPGAWPHTGKPEIGNALGEVLSRDLEYRRNDELRDLLASFEAQFAREEWRLLYPPLDHVYPARAR